VPAFKLEIVKENKPVICSGQELYKYLPHRPPVLLVDRYYGRDQRASYTGYIPVTGSLFCDSGLFLEEGLIEHISHIIYIYQVVDTNYLYVVSCLSSPENKTPDTAKAVYTHFNFTHNIICTNL
jgi:hypothetical protein